MHPFQHLRQGAVERSRVGKILADDKSADKSMIRNAVSNHEARLHEGEPKKARGGPISGKMSHGRLDKPHRARGGRVKAPVEVNVIVAGKDKSPMPGLGAVPLPPPPIPAPGPVGAPGGAPAGPGLPPGMPPMMRKRGGRVGKLTAAKAEGMKNATPVQNTPGGKTTKPDDFTDWPPVTKAKGGRVSPMTAGSLSGEGRLEKADWYDGRSRNG